MRRPDPHFGWPGPLEIYPLDVCTGLMKLNICLVSLFLRGDALGRRVGTNLKLS